jgi:hypothetical protein
MVEGGRHESVLLKLTGVLTKQVDINRHIVEFFKRLFGSPRLNNAHLEHDFYPREEQLGIAEKVLLSSLFLK